MPHLRAGDLEVHVAEMILVTENVGEHREALALEDQAHGDTRHRTAQGHTRIHQRERAAADGRHRGGAVRFRDLGDEAQRVGEFMRRRQDRTQGAPCQLAVADFAAPRRTDAARLTHGEGREVVVQQEAFLAGALQLVDELLVLAGSERRHDERLGLATEVNSAEPWVRGSTPTSETIGRTVFTSRPSMRSPSSRMAQRTILAWTSLKVALTISGAKRRLAVLGEKRLGHLRLGSVDGSIALLLVAMLVGGAQIGFDDLEHGRLDLGKVRRRENRAAPWRPSRPDG